MEINFVNGDATNVNYPFAKDKWASSFIACAYYFRRS